MWFGFVQYIFTAPNGVIITHDASDLTIQGHQYPPTLPPRPISPLCAGNSRLFICLLYLYHPHLQRHVQTCSLWNRYGWQAGSWHPTECFLVLCNYQWHEQMTSFIMSFPHKIQLCHKPDGFLVNCILYCVRGWSTYTRLFSQFSNVAPFIKEKSRIRYVLVYPKALFTSNVFFKIGPFFFSIVFTKNGLFFTEWVTTHSLRFLARHLWHNATEKRAVF